MPGMEIPKIPEKKLALIIPVHAEAISWMAVIGNVVLALRHPKNVGPSRQVARDFCRALVTKLQEEGVFTEEIAREYYMDLFT